MDIKVLAEEFRQHLDDKCSVITVGVSDADVLRMLIDAKIESLKEITDEEMLDVVDHCGDAQEFLDFYNLEWPT